MTDNPKVYMSKYGSVTEAVEAAIKLGNKAGASHEKGDDWHGTDTFKQACELAVNGWEAARPGVDAILKPVRDRLQLLLADEVQRLHDVVGGEVDVDRYLDGELECMYDDLPVVEPKNGRVFTLIINTCVNSGVNRKTIEARGAAIAALIEAFQMLNCDLNIFVEVSTVPGWGGNGYGHVPYETYTHITQVHRAGDNLDINNIMFPLGNAAWLRRICFADMEGCPQPLRAKWGIYPEGGSYGRAEDECTQAEAVDASIQMSMSASSHDQDITDPVGWVLQQLAIQGVFEGDVS